MRWCAVLWFSFVQAPTCASIPRFAALSAFCRAHSGITALIARTSALSHSLATTGFARVRWCSRYSSRFAALKWPLLGLGAVRIPRKPMKLMKPMKNEKNPFLEPFHRVSRLLAKAMKPMKWPAADGGGAWEAPEARFRCPEARFWPSRGSILALPRLDFWLPRLDFGSRGSIFMGFIGFIGLAWSLKNL